MNKIMQINYTRMVHEKLDLDDRAVNEVVRNKLRAMVAPGKYLREKNDVIMLMQDDPNWRHGSVSEEIVRIATELDIAVFKVLESLDQ